MAGHLNLARLNLFLPNEMERELQSFLETDVGSSMISLAASHYKQMMAELQYMEEKLPGLLCDLKTIQQKVDKRRKYSNVATISGCATSIVGGVMIVGGIAAAPFTLGATIGLTVAGTALGIGGGITTTGAKGVDFIGGELDYRKTNKMVDEFLEHYLRAKQAYEKISQICKELTIKVPVLETGDTRSARGLSAALNAVVFAAGLGIESTRMPRKAISGALDTLKICKAAIFSPAELHAATSLAAAPVKAVPLTRQFLVEAFSAAKCVTKFDASGFKLAVTTSFRTAGVLIKTAGGVLAVGGIILDAYTLISAGRELYKDKKCKVSQNISKHIEELEGLGRQLEKLNQDLTGSINAIRF